MIDYSQEGKHDYDGACAGNTNMATFSVGIFQYVRKSSGKSLKRGPVKYRVKGPSHMADHVYARAKHVCKLLDNGADMGKKSESIGSNVLIR